MINVQVKAYAHTRVHYLLVKWRREYNDQPLRRALKEAFTVWIEAHVNNLPVIKLEKMDVAFRRATWQAIYATPTDIHLSRMDAPYYASITHMWRHYFGLPNEYAGLVRKNLARAKRPLVYAQFLHWTKEQNSIEWLTTPSLTVSVAPMLLPFLKEAHYGIMCDFVSDEGHDKLADKLADNMREHNSLVDYLVACAMEQFDAKP